MRKHCHCRSYRFLSCSSETRNTESSSSFPTFQTPFFKSGNKQKIIQKKKTKQKQSPKKEEESRSRGFEEEEEEEMQFDGNGRVGGKEGRKEDTGSSKVIEGPGQRRWGGGSLGKETPTKLGLKKRPWDCGTYNTTILGGKEKEKEKELGF